MTIPRTTAKKLCTDVEYRLVNDSFAPHVAELSEKGVAQRIRRARAARDKYRSLAERQTREARGRIAPRGTRAAAGNKNTRVKQTLFDETLTRYEKQAARMNKDVGPKRSAAVAASGRSPRAATQEDGASSRALRSGSAAKSVKATKATKATKAAKGTQSGKATGTSRSAVASGTRKSQAGKSAAPGTTSKTAGRGKSQADAAGRKAIARNGAAGAAGMKSSSAPKASSAPKSSSAAKTAATSKSSVASKSPAGSGKKKAASRAPASRAGTVTRPVKIPPLKQVLAAVSDVVAARKEAAQSVQEAPPARSPKAPAVTNDGAPPGSPAADGVNRKGPEFPRNAHERGRVSAAFKRQQARRDSR